MTNWYVDREGAYRDAETDEELTVEHVEEQASLGGEEIESPFTTLRGFDEPVPEPPADQRTWTTLHHGSWINVGSVDESSPIEPTPPPPDTSQQCMHCATGLYIDMGRHCRWCRRWKCADCALTYSLDDPRHPHQIVYERAESHRDGRGQMYYLCAEHVLISCRGCGHPRPSTWAGTGPDMCYNCQIPCEHCARYRSSGVNDSHVCSPRDLERQAARLSAIQAEREARAVTERRRTLIRNYSYKPDPEFHGRSRDGLFFGIEQEVEAARSVAHGYQIVEKVQPLDTHGLFYYKSDGSIHNGCEIVSHPMTFAWFKANYPRDYAEALGEVATAPSNTGVHIHASRDAFSPYHLFKFQQFFYNNPALVVQVAGRESSYAKLNKDAVGFHKVRDRRSGDIIMSADAMTRALAWEGKREHEPFGMRVHQADRYVAVNLQNEHTVEVRVFAGTVDFSRLSSYMEFMHAAYYYTQGAKWHTKNIMRGLTEDGFRAYIARFPHRYGNLNRVISAVGRP